MFRISLGSSILGQGQVWTGTWNLTWGSRERCYCAPPRVESQETQPVSLCKSPSGWKSASIPLAPLCSIGLGFYRAGQPLLSQLLSAASPHLAGIRVPRVIAACRTPRRWLASTA